MSSNWEMHHYFYPRNAMRARLLAMARCLSASASVTSRSSIETDGRIEFFFGTEATLGLSYILLERNLSNSKMRNFNLELYIRLWASKISPLHVGLRKCCHRIRVRQLRLLSCAALSYAYCKFTITWRRVTLKSKLNKAVTNRRLCPRFAAAYIIR